MVHGNMLNGWGVVQLVGRLTVNEDGVGSSPTAPANYPVRIATALRISREL